MRPKICHSCFKFWRNFQKKDEFCWVAVTKSTPPDYYGNVYKVLAPIGKQFEKTVDPFNERAFLEEYKRLLKSLDREEVRKDLLSFSKHGKPVVILNWEDLTRWSEGRITFAWMNKLTIEEADKFDLEHLMAEEERKKDLIYGESFLEL